MLALLLLSACALLFAPISAVGGEERASAPAAPPATAIAAHRARIQLFPEHNRLAVADTLLLPAGIDSLVFSRNLRLLRVGGAEAGWASRLPAPLDSTPDTLAPQGTVAVALADLNLAAGGSQLLEYEACFYQPSTDVTFSREKVGGEIVATVGPEGVYLSGEAAWLPQVPGALATHRLTIETPAGWRPVTQGARLAEQEQDGRLVTTWEAAHPSDGIALVAAPYTVTTDSLDGIEIATYLLEPDEQLSALYLERTRYYLQMYREMLGPYAYRKFATVENWFPTGYGMPSWTLLGAAVMRLPFIPYTSFGHEICHDWWGNSVFVGEGGNWCEGLTSYCADYHYQELESPEAAREYRRNLLKDYAAYVADGSRDFPLTEFESRHSGATRAVGYGKAMMVFHMVERTIGGEPFGQALRDVYRDHRFQRAAWADFFAAFTAVSNRDFTAFQEQWLTRPGAPMIRLTAAERRGDDVRFNLEQDQPVYDLLVPVVITTPAGEQEREVELRTTAQAYSLTVPAASRLAIDPDYHLFRRLHPQEIEATVRQVLAEDVPLFVLPPGDEQMIAAARRFAVTFSGNETPMVVEGGHPPADVRAGSATDGVLLDPPPEVLREWLPAGVTVAGDLLFIEGLRYDLRQNDAVLAVPHPHDPGATYLIVLCRSPGRLEGLANRLGHYGKYSWLVFPAGRGQVTRGNWQPVGSPLVAELE